MRLEDLPEFKKSASREELHLVLHHTSGIIVIGMLTCLRVYWNVD